MKVLVLKHRFHERKNSFCPEETILMDPESVCVFQVRLGSRQMPHTSLNRRSLSHSHCVELANYYFGFNGWRTDIITVRNTQHQITRSTFVNVRWLHLYKLQLKELTDEHEAAAEGGVPFRRLKFGCELKVSFPLHGQTINAAAVVEDSFTCTGKNWNEMMNPWMLKRNHPQTHYS